MMAHLRHLRVPPPACLMAMKSPMCRNIRTIGAFVFGEVPGPETWAGGTMILAGTWVAGSRGYQFERKLGAAGG